MTRTLAHVTLIVRDYDEAIAWFTGKLGFTVVADEYQPEQDKRWVLVAPSGAPEGGATLLLARAATPGQEAAIGRQAAGRCFCSSRPTTSSATMPRCSRTGSSSCGRPRLRRTARSPCSSTCAATAGT